MYHLHQKVALNTKNIECTMPARLPLGTQHHQINMLVTLVSSINRQFKVKTSIFLFLSGARLLHMLMQPPNHQNQPGNLPNHLDKPFPISIGHYQTSIPLSSDPRVRKSAPIRVFAGVILTYPSLSKVPGGSRELPLRDTHCASP